MSKPKEETTMYLRLCAGRRVDMSDRSVSILLLDPADMTKGSFFPYKPKYRLTLGNLYEIPGSAAAEGSSLLLGSARWAGRSESTRLLEEWEAEEKAQMIEMEMYKLGKESAELNAMIRPLAKLYKKQVAGRRTAFLAYVISRMQSHELAL